MLFFPPLQSADGLTAARAHEETGLLLLSYVVSITHLLHKGGCLMVWRVHSSPPPALLCLFEPHKRKRGLTLPEAEDPAPRSEHRNISATPFFRGRCPSVWCQLSPGQRQRETQPLYLPYTGCLCAINEPEYRATETQRLGDWRRLAFAELNSDN